MPSFGEKLNLSPIRLGDAVYEQVAGAIVDGTLAPGERIRDVDIAKELGISRMPVREALQRLEREGLIEMSASRFTRVTEVTQEAVAATLEYTRYQSATAARLAVERLDDGGRERIAAILENLREAAAARDIDGLRQSLVECYLFFVEQTGNGVFQAVSAEMRFAVERNLRGAELAAPDGEQLAGVVEAVEDALRQRKPDAAESAVHALFRIVT